MWTDLVVSLIREKNSMPPHMLAILEDFTQRHDLLARLSEPMRG